MASKDTKEVLDAANSMRPFLRDREPEIQGAILAELLSCWLAGHFSGTPKLTHKLREILLTKHIKAVRELIPVNEDALLERERKSGRMQ